MNNRETHRASEIINNNNTYLIKDYLKKIEKKKFSIDFCYIRELLKYIHISYPKNLSRTWISSKENISRDIMGKIFAKFNIDTK